MKKFISFYTNLLNIDSNLNNLKNKYIKSNIRFKDLLITIYKLLLNVQLYLMMVSLFIIVFILFYSVIILNFLDLITNFIIDLYNGISPYLPCNMFKKYIPILFDLDYNVTMSYLGLPMFVTMESNILDYRKYYRPNNKSVYPLLSIDKLLELQVEFPLYQLFDLTNKRNVLLDDYFHSIVLWEQIEDLNITRYGESINQFLTPVSYNWNNQSCIDQIILVNQSWLHFSLRCMAEELKVFFN